MTAQTLGELIDGHAGPLELYAAQWTNAPGDVVQDAFLLLFRSDLPANPVAWLYRTVRHRALNASRSQRRRERHERQAGTLRGRLTSDGHLDWEPADVAEALDGLPADEREVLIARIWGNLTLEEIADVTGVSVSTAHRRFQSGLATLRKRLSKWTFDHTTNKA